MIQVTFQELEDLAISWDKYAANVVEDRLKFGTIRTGVRGTKENDAVRGQFDRAVFLVVILVCRGAGNKGL
jgi:hypothetical protein